MTDPLRARLTALITEMRAQGRTEAWDAASFHWADEIEAALRAAPARALTQADIEPLWTATFNRNDWTHIVAFANAVRRISAAPEAK